MTIIRVQWRERQRLSSADLDAEQHYRLHALGRHLLAPHDWGIVRGLSLKPEQARFSLRWRLNVGVAVDGYGRELLVRESIDFELPPDAMKQRTYRVYLYYCESDSSNPPCEPCRDDPAQRTNQHVQLFVSDTLEPVTGPAVDLALARAAGRVTDLPAWPVLVGTITLGSLIPVTLGRPYHAQRASILRSPSGRVALRQGLLGPSDQYHLLLAAKSGATAPEKRVALDRDGVAHVWKRLILSGAKGTAVVAVSASATLLVETDMPVGADRRFVIKGAIENAGAPRLTLCRLDESGAREVIHADLLKGGRAFLDSAFRFMDTSPVLLRLIDAERPSRRIQVTHAIKGEQERALVMQEFVAAPQPSGGLLRLATRELPLPDDGVASCDDDMRAPRRGISVPPLTGGVAFFRAAVQPMPAPTARAILAAPESRADGMPLTALRLSGGEFDEGDHSARVTLGARKLTEPDGFGWSSIVSVDGGGRTRMPQKKTRLAVSGRLQLPAISTSPADPLTQDLLAISYSAGLRRAGRLAPPQITVSFPAVPATVKRGDTLKYQVTISRGTLGAVILKRVIEGVVGRPASINATYNGNVALRTVPLLSGSLNITKTEEIPDFQHAADNVVIALELLVSIAGKDYALAAASGLITVTD